MENKALEERLAKIEARLTAIENLPVATLEVTKPKRVSTRKERTPEQKAEKVRQLREGKAKAKAAREAAGKAKAATEKPKDKHGSVKVVKPATKVIQKAQEGESNEG